MKVAILVDGDFFIKRARKLYPPSFTEEPANLAKTLHTMALGHVSSNENELYRILYYDCKPLTKKAHLPISSKAIDFSRTKQASFRLDFHHELKKMRKVAIRLGTLRDKNAWVIKPNVLRSLLHRDQRFEDLRDEDLMYDVRQKGVDIKIGLDIASLAYKRLVNQIVLVSGDSDFVPAAELARREGIDVILDPMWNSINPDLHEHIDGLKSVAPRSRERHPKKNRNEPRI